MGSMDRDPSEQQGHRRGRIGMAARHGAAILLLLGLWSVGTRVAAADGAGGVVLVSVQGQDGAPVSSAVLSWGYIGTSFVVNNAGVLSGPGLYRVGVQPDTPIAVCAQASTATQTASACSPSMTVLPGATVSVTLVLSIPGGAAEAASTDRGWIVGTVTLASSHAPVADVAVQLADTPVHTTTGTDGHYQFPAISTTDGANGGPIYTVHITPPPDYTSVGSASQQVTVQADHGVEADFTLQPLPCHFVLGFAALHAAIPSSIGDCVDDEQHNPTNGDALQHTTHGLLVWRKVDNFTSFTDGYHTWVNGPDGLQQRLNSQRFAWEANPDRLPVIQ